MGTHVEEGAGGGGAWPDEVGGAGGTKRGTGEGRRNGKEREWTLSVWVGGLVALCGWVWVSVGRCEWVHKHANRNQSTFKPGGALIGSRIPHY